MTPAEIEQLRLKRIGVELDDDMRRRLDELNILLKLGDSGLYAGFQKMTNDQTNWRTIIPVITPGHLSARPWGVWKERSGRRVSSFLRFDGLETRMKERLGII